jgi:hypothetical protein
VTIRVGRIVQRQAKQVIPQVHILLDLDVPQRAPFDQLLSIIPQQLAGFGEGEAGEYVLERELRANLSRHDATLRWKQIPDARTVNVTAEMPRANGQWWHPMFLKAWIRRNVGPPNSVIIVARRRHAFHLQYTRH